MRILVAGASGYVGSRLVPVLVEGGAEVVALSRNSGRLAVSLGCHAGLTTVVADLLDPASLEDVLDDVDLAYYLVHSMDAGADFVEKDGRAAANFAAAAKRAGLPRIIYLGGLVPPIDEEDLSPHLASRLEVGRILRDSEAVVQELRASIILGRGSSSFEMVRALVERLPVMVTPRWVSNRTQPIATDDLVECLIAAASLEPEGHRVYEVGGPDIVSYRDIMQEYARQRGLARLMIPVPVLTPWVSSLWLSLVTPLYASVGRHLLESIRNPTVVTRDASESLLGSPPLGIAEAIAISIRASRGNALDDFVASKYGLGPRKGLNSER
jgi:uncharacterized protein YbjT (DUF2867 family)